MKKPFVFLEIIFIILLALIYFGSTYVNFYNIEFLHPLFWLLVPITFLGFFCIWLKNINFRYFFLVITLFLFVSFTVLSFVDPICRQIICFDRNVLALILSFLFSVIYFIVILFQNKNK